jgi:hypothetical protein
MQKYPGKVTAMLWVHYLNINSAKAFSTVAFKKNPALVEEQDFWI